MKPNHISRGFSTPVLILALLVVLGAGWYLSQQGILGSSAEVGSATTSPQSVEPAASEPEVVVTEDSTQIGEFTGYYEALEREAWGESATCHTFVVVRGAPKLTQYFKDMVEDGNGVQSLTEQGQLRINLPWGEIPTADQTAVQASASGSPITLTLKKKVQIGTGASACYSFFTYIRIES
jgi:hypothetical protein